MSAITVYISDDSAARSLGADEVATVLKTEADKRGIEITLVRNSTHGMLWLEPLVEVATPQGRTAYGPVTPKDVIGLFDTGFLDGKSHPLCQGITQDLPWLKNQNRVTFARLGITDPLVSCKS